VRKHLLLVREEGGGSGYGGVSEVLGKPQHCGLAACSQKEYNEGERHRENFGGGGVSGWRIPHDFLGGEKRTRNARSVDMGGKLLLWWGGSR